MFKVLGLILWWTFLKGADMLVESLYEAVPLWLRIGVVAALGVGAIPLMFSREIKGWGAGRRAPAPEHSAEITSDGKEVAKMMLRAHDLDEVERLRTTYKRATHPEGRLFEHFVNKAYSYRLDKAGDRDKAQEFHDVVESNDKDSVRESVEFAFLVNEVEKESKHDG